MNGRAVVEVRDLTKVYLPSPAWMRIFLRTQVRVAVRALDSISLHVEGGQICAIAGPNGAGKTTLFKILTGLLAPTSGSAAVLGIDATRESPQLRRVVGFMSGEDRSLWLRLTCVQNLEFRGRLQGLRSEELRARIADVLDAVGLGDVGDRVGFALSAGMRARLQLACALLHQPPVLILDEPTGSVDPVGSFELLEMIRPAVQQDGGDLILVEADVEGGAVEVMLQGSCSSCAISIATRSPGRPPAPTMRCPIRLAVRLRSA